MSPFAENIAAQINLFIRGYPLDWGTNLNLNRILLLLTQLADTGSATGGGSANGAIYPIVSANFANATDCPLPSLVNATFTLYWNEDQKFLEQDAGEWEVISGGGFRVLVPGFNSAAQNYHFYIFIQGGVITSTGLTPEENVTVVHSTDFINATDCPITALNGHNLVIYYAQGNKFLDSTMGDWVPLTGGGFRVTIPGFNSAAQNYTFYVFQSS